MTKMGSESIEKRRQVDKIEDNFVAGENRPLIPDDKYQVKCIHYETGRSHHNSIKLFLHFKIIEGKYFETTLFMAINLSDSRTGKEFKKVPSGSKYYESWVIANNNQLPSRGDRMSPKVFKNKIFEVKTRIVRPKFNDGTEKPECFHYTVVDHIIERLA
jgi:hypothetical protein